MNSARQLNSTSGLSSTPEGSVGLAPLVVQIANAFFLLAALFSDVLLIRVFLSLAFILLLVNCVIAANSGKGLAVDGLLWALVNGGLHWWASASLLREILRNLRAASEACQPSGDEGALFCYFHRRTGMYKTDFARILACGELRPFSSGALICDTATARSHLHVIVEGKIRIEYRFEPGVAEAAGERGTYDCGSGDAFDFRTLNICGVFIGFPNEMFNAHALTDGACFRLPLKELADLVQHNRHLLGFLRTFTLSQLACAFHREVVPRTPQRDSFGQLEDQAWEDGARSRDFSPLSTEEANSMAPSLSGTLDWLRDSLSPFVQPGCRHASNPFSGSLAQASVQSQRLDGLTDLLEAHRRSLGSGTTARDRSAPPQGQTRV